MQKFLIIQTAFIGDVVLATSLIEKLHAYFPDAQIDFLLRKGNESLLTNHPYLHEVLIWDKKRNKQRNLIRMIYIVQKKKYDKVINVQRFAATGLLTVLSRAKETIGFDKNPFSFLFDKKIKHIVSDGKTVKHETERNQDLIKAFTDDRVAKPVLYPSQSDYDFVRQYKEAKYITLSPASVWFTKQYPAVKWIGFINKIPQSLQVHLLGASSDSPLCDSIRQSITHVSVTNLCGKLSFLQSAALMKDAAMNYVNDSAPLHFASAMNAPTTAVYCSTIPAFGFGPLSDKKYIVQISEPLYCRPCGLHGYRACPEKHFKCAYGIQDEQLLESMVNSH